ncbi:MAG: zinc ribbon domain-containing protein [Planctomycetota bacterium]
MPVYEFACSKCFHVTEAIRRMADADTPEPCEKCGTLASRQHSVFMAEASKPASVSQPWRNPGPGGTCGCGKPHGGCDH